MRSIRAIFVRRESSACRISRFEAARSARVGGGSAAQDGNSAFAETRPRSNLYADSDRSGEEAVAIPVGPDPGSADRDGHVGTNRVALPLIRSSDLQNVHVQIDERLSACAELQSCVRGLSGKQELPLSMFLVP